MGDNTTSRATLPLGHQIRRLRVAQGWTLAELARRAGTSAPALHRYESGWDRFEVATLRRIASALGAELQIRLVPARREHRRRSRRQLVALLSPLFWDRDLTRADLDRYAEWVLARTLMFGNREQVAAARRHFGDDAILRAVERRGVDARTRGFWRLVLDEETHAPEGHQC
jgi:transcriptional regulator with XRE-family HTH domain